MALVLKAVEHEETSIRINVKEAVHELLADGFR